MKLGLAVGQKDECKLKQKKIRYKFLKDSINAIIAGGK